MAFAGFAGVQAATLALDPPYPAYYRELTENQAEIKSVEALCRIITAVDPSHRLEPAPTSAMAAGGGEALDRIGAAIQEGIRSGADWSAEPADLLATAAH